MSDARIHDKPCMEKSILEIFPAVKEKDDEEQGGTAKHSRDRTRRLVPWYSLFAGKKTQHTRLVPYTIDLLHN